MSNGIDVSHYQNKIDYSQVAKDGYEFVIAKATEGSKAGSNIVDPFFVRNITEANKNGLQTNAYHYFLGISETDAEAEADLCLENLKKVDLTGYVFVDVEDKSLTQDKDALTNYVNAFLNHLEANGYTKLGIYASRSFYQDRLVPDKLKPGIIKWIAAYNNQGAGIDCDIWQHQSDGKVNGINGNCDLNISYTDKIGKQKEVVKKDTNYSSYTIKKGDNFWDIETTLKLDHGTLQKLNPKVDPTRLQVGQKINVPQTVKPSVKYHIVEKDENLTVIANHYKLSLSQIEKLNPQISNPNIISIGQKIRVK